MALSVQCPACQRKLNVPETLLGKRVKCPSCAEAFQVTQTPPPEAENPKKAKAQTESIVPAPKRPGSSSTSKKVEDEPDAETEPVYEHEAERKPRPRRRRSRNDDDDEEDDRPARRRRRNTDGDDDDYERPRRRMQPHRGALVLTLGIVSLFVWCCPLAGLIMGGIVLNLANKDHADMAARRMDDAGYGITMAGKICAIIALVLSVLNFIGGIIWQVAIR